MERDNWRIVLLLVSLVLAIVSGQDTPLDTLVNTPETLETIVAPVTPVTLAAATPVSPPGASPPAAVASPPAAPTPSGFGTWPFSYNCNNSEIAFCQWYTSQKTFANGVEHLGACCTSTEAAKIKEVYDAVKTQNAAFYDPDKGDCEDRLALLLCKPCSNYKTLPTCTPFCESIDAKCFPTAYINTQGNLYNWAVSTTLFPDNRATLIDVEAEPRFREFGCQFCIRNVLGSNCSDIDVVGHDQCFNASPLLAPLFSAMMLVVIAVMLL